MSDSDVVDVKIDLKLDARISARLEKRIDKLRDVGTYARAPVDVSDTTETRRLVRLLTATATLYDGVLPKDVHARILDRAARFVQEEGNAAPSPDRDEAIFLAMYLGVDGDPSEYYPADWPEPTTIRDTILASNILSSTVEDTPNEIFDDILEWIVDRVRDMHQARAKEAVEKYVRVADYALGQDNGVSLGAEDGGVVRELFERRLSEPIVDGSVDVMTWASPERVALFRERVQATGITQSALLRALTANSFFENDEYPEEYLEKVENPEFDIFSFARAKGLNTILSALVADADPMATISKVAKDLVRVIFDMSRAKRGVVYARPPQERMPGAITKVDGTSRVDVQRSNVGDILSEIVGDEYTIAPTGSSKAVHTTAAERYIEDVVIVAYAQENPRAFLDRALPVAVERGYLMRRPSDDEVLQKYGLRANGPEQTYKELEDHLADKDIKTISEFITYILGYTGPKLKLEEYANDFKSLGEKILKYRFNVAPVVAHDLVDGDTAPSEERGNVINLEDEEDDEEGGEGEDNAEEEGDDLTPTILYLRAFEPAEEPME